jgi:hypothetical protein
MTRPFVICQLGAGYVQQLRTHQLRSDVKNDFDAFDTQQAFETLVDLLNGANPYSEVSRVRALALGQLLCRLFLRELARGRNQKATIEEMAEMALSSSAFVSFYSVEDIEQAKAVLVARYEDRELTEINEQLAGSNKQLRGMTAQRYQRVHDCWETLSVYLAELVRLLRGADNDRYLGKKGAAAMLILSEYSEVIRIGQKLMLMNKENSEWNL